MALTRSFKKTLQAHTDRRREALREGMEIMFGGGVDTDKAILRDYIKATVGFEKLGAASDVAEEPGADVRPQGQPASEKPVRRHRPAAEAGERQAVGGRSAASAAPSLRCR